VAWRLLVAIAAAAAIPAQTNPLRVSVTLQLQLRRVDQVE